MAGEEVTFKMEDDCPPEWYAVSEIKKEVDSDGEATIKFESELILDENDHNEAYSAGLPVDVKLHILQGNAAPSNFRQKCPGEFFEEVFVKSEPGFIDEGISEASEELERHESTEVKIEDEIQDFPSDVGPNNRDATPLTSGDSGMFLEKIHFKSEQDNSDAGTAISGIELQRGELTGFGNEGTVKTGFNELPCNEIPSRAEKSALHETGNPVFDVTPCTVDSKTDSVNSVVLINSNEKQFSCNHCSEKFESPICLNQHLETHFYCKQCLEGFLNETCLKHHLATSQACRIADEPLSCETCSKRFESKVRLVRHSLRCHPVKSTSLPFRCKKCSVRCKTFRRLLRHLSVHSDNKPFACEQCSARFSRSVHLKRHIANVHTAIKRCSQCAAQFKGTLELKQHLAVHFRGRKRHSKVHSKSSEKHPIVELSDDTEDFPSDVGQNISQKKATPSTFPGSPGIFPDKISVKLEPDFIDAGISIYSEERQRSESAEAEIGVTNEGIVKTGCNELSCNKTPLKVAKKAIPPLIPLIRGNSNKIHCTTNSEIGLIDLTVLDFHRTNSDEKQLSCKVCSEQFKSNALLKQHLMLKEVFGCDQCSACFHTEIDRKKHAVEHSIEKTSDKRFACEKCPARFKRKLNLEKHYARHAGENKFWCKQCSARCKSLGRLKRHLAIHSDHKPFACEQCPARFSRNVHLRTHLSNVHTAKKRFSCDLCRAQFKKMQALRQHLIAHSDNKPFSCNKCGWSFKRNYELTRHIKVHSKRSEKYATAQLADHAEGEEILGI